MKESHNPDQSRKPKIGVVVGSGGMKALSSIALFEFLDEVQIDVDLLIGCSGGSSVLASWACGNNAEVMTEQAYKFWGNKDLLTRTDYRTLLSIAGLPFGRFDKSRGLLKSDLALKAYDEMFGERRIEDLRIRTMFQTTDLLSGEPVMLSKGLLRDAVYASGALFPLLPALCIDGRWLMDGVYSSPLPVLEAVNNDMDVVIAMTYEERTTSESRGFVPYFMRCQGYSHHWLQRNQTALSVEMHHHEIVFINVVFDKFISLRSVRRIPEILEKGKKAVEQKKEEILAAINSFSG
ncbi:MAG: patatin-like phospholipase family protein [bacterium]|nr:MAG: patatin-like phospholipase family protein [bacterium]